MSGHSFRLAGLAAITFFLTAPAAAQKSKDTLRYPNPEAQSTLDTYLYPGSFANIWETSIYSNLLGFDPAKGQYTPLLVRAWSQPDPLTYELDLRDNVKWHDGQAFGADDVVYTLNYLIDPKVRLRLKQSWAWIKTVEKLSPTKVRIVAKEAVPDGLMWLSYGTPMYPRHIHGAQEDKNDFGSKPIGTGPYRMAKLDKNTGVVAEKYAGYVPGPMNPAGSIGRIVSEPIEDSGTIVATMLADRADVAVDLPVEEALSLSKTGKFDVALAPPRVGYIFLQFPTAAWSKVKPLSDPRVRAAIVKGIDRKVLLDSIYGPLAKDVQPTEGLCSKEQLGCGFTKPVPGYDPEGAKKLLAEAGYSDGFDVTVSSYRDNVDDATAISGMMRKIGIRMNVRPIHSSQRLRSVQSGEVEVGYFGWSGGNMFTVAPQIVRHFQLGEYSDPQMTKLIEPIAKTMDDGERRKASAKAFDYLTDNVYAVAMVPNREIFTMTKEVGIRAPNELRTSQLNPQDFYWK